MSFRPCRRVGGKLNNHPSVLSLGPGEHIKTWRPRYFTLFDDGKLLGFKQAPLAGDFSSPLNDFNVRDSQVRVGSPLNDFNVHDSRVRVDSPLNDINVRDSQVRVSSSVNDFSVRYKLQLTARLAMAVNRPGAGHTETVVG